MLKKLLVDQFVIIDRLELDFASGLTIFTGETGAGKSIILGAMGLILGEPSKKSAIRQGQDQSSFEAVVAPPQGHPVWEFMIKNQLLTTMQSEFSIHRVMKQQGDDDIKVNGVNVSEELLKELGEYLIEIHGQFANHTLLGPANQLNLLDAAGAFPQEVFDNVSGALDDVHRLEKELEEEKTFLARHKGLRGKKVEDVCRRFDDIGMKEGFIEELKEEYATLRRAKETMEAFQSILGRFIATNGIIGSLGAANKTLAAQKNIDQEQMQALSDHLAQSLSHASAAVEEMNSIIPEYEIDLTPLEEAKRKLGILKTLAQEAKIQFEDLNGYWADMSSRRDRIRNGREKLKQLNDDLANAKNGYREHANVLSEKRTEAAKKMSADITAELPPLKLEKAEFIVTVEQKSDMEWTKKGFDEITFTARMNPGMPFSPISETASGGELARMILALKVVLQSVQVTSTLVFDEVDTGIGGAAAAAVGDRIAMLAAGTQVLVITHSPQVASRGNQHLYISKRSEEDVTLSSVTELTMDQRVEELSRMLAGDTLTAESKAAARSLIDEAEKAAAARQ